MNSPQSAINSEHIQQHSGCRTYDIFPFKLGSAAVCILKKKDIQMNFESYSLF